MRRDEAEMEVKAVRQYLADNGFDSTGIDDNTCEELYVKVRNRGEEEEKKDPEQVVEDLEEMLKELTVVKTTAAVTDEDEEEEEETTVDNKVYVSRRLTHDEWITMAKTNMKPHSVAINNS